MEDKFAIIVNGLTYILNKFPDNTLGVHKLFKILYFAEQMHLCKYGKPITGDDFHALPYGPVPTIAYNIVKASRQEHVEDILLNEFSKFFTCRGRNVKALKDVDLDWLSNSELECIDKSFSENKDLSFSQLTDKSHDTAWDNAYPVMNVKDIAKAGGASNDIINYISDNIELESIEF